MYTKGYISDTVDSVSNKVPISQMEILLPIPIRDVIEGIQVYYPRYLEFPRPLFLASSGIRVHQGIMKLVKKIEREFSFDLIHAHMALPDGYASMLISMEYQRPMVVTFRATDLDITTKGSKDFLRT